MGRVAEQVGISRQSLYKEIGSKAALGEAVIAREAEQLLAGVIGQLRAHGGNCAPTVATPRPGCRLRPSTCCAPGPTTP